MLPIYSSLAGALASTFIVADGIARMQHPEMGGFIEKANERIPGYRYWGQPWHHGRKVNICLGIAEVCLGVAGLWMSGSDALLPLGGFENCNGEWLSTHEKSKLVFEEYKVPEEYLTPLTGRSTWLSEHPFQRWVEEHSGENLLPLNANDERPKALFLMGGHYSVDAMVLRKYAPAEVSLVRRTHDVIFRMVSTVEEFCGSIKEASATGGLDHLFIKAHGDPLNIDIHDETLILAQSGGGLGAVNLRNLTIQQITSTCFDGLKEEAPITLLSCATGALHDGIASVLARASGHTVVAPKFDTNYFSCHFQPLCFPPVRYDTLTFPFWSNTIERITSAARTCIFSPDGTHECL